MATKKTQDEDHQTVTDEAAERRRAFNATLRRLNEKMKKKEEGDNVITLLSDAPRDVPRVSSGLLDLDVALGGGYGQGRIVEIFGPESAGKTTLALKMVANTQKKADKNCLYVDTEHALNPAHAARLGVDLNNLALAQPFSAENAMELVKMAAESGVVDVIILDSVAALTPKAELEGEISDQRVGELARIVSKSLRNIIGAAHKNNVSIFFINQNRVKIGGFASYGEPTDTTGGKALKYYATTRVQVRGTRVGGSSTTNPTGLEMNMTVVKNKIAPPFRKAKAVFNFEGEPFDQPLEVFEASKKMGVLAQQPGKKTIVHASTGEVLSTSGAPKAIEHLREHPELVDALYEETLEALRKAPTEASQQTEEPDAEDEHDETEF